MFTTSFTQYFDPVLKKWSSRGMYMRSLFLKQLAGNQLGTTGLLVTCVSHHMTDMQFSNKAEDEVLKTNSLGIADGVDLLESVWKGLVGTGSIGIMCLPECDMGRICVGRLEISLSALAHFHTLRLRPQQSDYTHRARRYFRSCTGFGGTGKSSRRQDVDACDKLCP